MGMIPKYAQLQSLSDQDLIDCYDSETEHTVVGTRFYLDALSRRAMESQTQEMLGFTRHVRNLTWVITVLTLVNIALVAWSLKG